MNYDLEKTVWAQAQQQMPLNDFAVLVEDAVQAYRRPQGYRRLERVYASGIGTHGLETLRSALQRHGLFDAEHVARRFSG